MGRFSPTVAPVANDGLANALGNFTETYMQFSARKRQKDMDAIQTGVGLEPVNPSAPSNVPSGPIAALRARLTGRGNPNDIASAVRNAAPAVEGASRVNAGIADALSRGESYTPSPTAEPELPQQMRLPSGQVISTAMTPVGQRMLQARLAALGLNSEIGLRNSEIAKNNREANVPRLGDKNYAGAVAEVEGAKAEATLHSELEKLVAQGAISRETALAVERAREGSAAALQGNQQRFTAGENAKSRTAEADRQTTAKGEELSNKLTEIQATQAGQLMPTLMRKVGGLANFSRGTPGTLSPFSKGAAPSADAAPAADVKQQRADWDAAAAHARQQGKDPDELLGPRP